MAPPEMQKKHQDSKLTRNQKSSQVQMCFCRYFQGKITLNLNFSYYIEPFETKIDCFMAKIISNGSFFYLH